MGWGPLAWEGAPGRRPRPLGTPRGAVRMLARPPVALAQPACSCEGFGVPAQTQLSPSCVCSGSGRAQGSAPGAAERGSAPQSGHAPLNSLAPPGARACAGPREPAAGPQVQRLPPLPRPPPRGPLLPFLHSPPVSTKAPAVPGLLWSPRHPDRPPPGLPGGSRRHVKPRSCLSSAPCRQLLPPPNPNTFCPSPGA